MAKGKGSATKRIFRSADQRNRMPYTIPELWSMGEENRKHVLGNKYEEYEAIYSFGNSNVIPSKATVELPPIGTSTAPDVDASVQPSAEDAAIAAQNPTPSVEQENATDKAKTKSKKGVRSRKKVGATGTGGRKKSSKISQDSDAEIDKKVEKITTSDTINDEDLMTSSKTDQGSDEEEDSRDDSPLTLSSDKETL